MDLEDLPIFDQLAQLPNRTYSYVVIAAVAGPMALRLFGFKTLGQLIRPLALVVLLSGMYAKQQRAGSSSTERR
ncbi:MAG TPA: hypothetical protein VGD69_13305 [Herpetosiphonaceae bacterium]